MIIFRFNHPADLWKTLGKYRYIAFSEDHTRCFTVWLPICKTNRITQGIHNFEALKALADNCSTSQTKLSYCNARTIATVIGPELFKQLKHLMGEVYKQPRKNKA